MNLDVSLNMFYGRPALRLLYVAHTQIHKASNYLCIYFMYYIRHIFLYNKNKLKNKQELLVKNK